MDCIGDRLERRVRLEREGGGVENTQTLAVLLLMLESRLVMDWKQVICLPVLSFMQ